jgi:hypothetical protein
LLFITRLAAVAQQAAAFIVGSRRSQRQALNVAFGQISSAETPWDNQAALKVCFQA